jgi:hypothetical protein
MMVHLLSLLVQAWRFVAGPAIYHPAARYMRGPGPKYREKMGGKRPQE